MLNRKCDPKDFLNLMSRQKMITCPCCLKKWATGEKNCCNDICFYLEYGNIEYKRCCKNDYLVNKIGSGIIYDKYQLLFCFFLMFPNGIEYEYIKIKCNPYYVSNETDRAKIINEENQIMLKERWVMINERTKDSEKISLEDFEMIFTFFS